MKKYLLLYALTCVLLILTSFTSSAQNKPADWYLVEDINYEKLNENDKHLLDSILPLYHQATNDTVKLYYLNIIIEGTITETLWPKYNDLMLKLSENRAGNCYVKYYAATINNKGYLADIKGNASVAISYYTKALQIREKINDK